MIGMMTFAAVLTGGMTVATPASTAIAPSIAQLAMQRSAGTNMVIEPADDTTHVCSSGCSNPFPSQVIYSLQNNSGNNLEVLVSQEAAEGSPEFLLFNGSASPYALTIDPWGSAAVTATINDSINYSDGIYSCEVTFEDLTMEGSITRTHTLEIGIPTVTITPDENLNSEGPVGGPFPGTRLYRATSSGPSSVPLRVTASEPWVSINGQAGEYEINVPGNGSYANLNVGINSAANSLPAGVATATLTFDNTHPQGVGDATRTVKLVVGREIYPGTDVPLALNDYGVTTSEIEITDDFCTGDLNVAVDLTHPAVEDIEISVISPLGTQVILHNRSPGSNNIIRLYDDDGTAPDGPGELHDFYPEAAMGTWQLRVRDLAVDNEGTLNSWSLQIASTGSTCPPTCQDIDLVIDQDETVDIELIGNSYYDNPLSYIITSLPGDAAISLPTGGSITTVPYTIPAGGNMIRFNPVGTFIGADGFSYMVDDGTPSQEALVSLKVGQLPNPDDCFDAYPIGNGLWDYDTTGATTDGPADESCEFDGQTYNDIWYVFTACFDGTLIVSTCGTANYDTDLVVYDGDDCNNLVTLGCSDDGPGCPDYSSYLEVPVIAEQSYLVRVGGWNAGDSGTGELLIDGPEGDCGDDPPPPDCPGDANGDGLADVNDVLAIISVYGTNDPDGDLTGDGVVDVNDILLLLTWFNNC
ncbi:MAG: proprotein convertase P-domain-containing protein [Phycisphaerales bacterium]|nr:proprotein convertase P-domain-containing protein [Phycisphaerales bacterium]